MKRHNPYTGEVHELGNYMYSSYYVDALENKEYWKLPRIAKANFMHNGDKIGDSLGRDLNIFYRDTNNELYFSTGASNMIISFYDMAGFLSSGDADPIDIDINRVGKKMTDWSLLNICHVNGNAQAEGSKEYWSKETKKLYNIKGEIMEDYKLESVYISKIENGFIITASMSKSVKDREKWEDFKTYCETLDQVKVKLEEIYK